MPEELDLPEAEEPVSPEPEPAQEQEELVTLAPPAAEADDEPISLVEPEGAEEGHGEVHAFGAGTAEVEKKQYKRQLNLTGQGATRCKVFHSRIAEAPLTHMEEQINDWLDGEKIEVKHVGHVIGIMEGKTPQPNVIVTVWY